MKQFIPATTALATLAALALSACGTTAPAASDSSPIGSSSSKAGPIVMTDATGAKVTLDKAATNVIATEWNVTEDLLALGVNPTGVADVKGYTAWDTAAPLKSAPKDIGTRGEPSLDTIATLRPDLIVATTDLSAATIAQLRKVAPTMVVPSAKGSDQLGLMRERLAAVAKATGTTTRANTLWNGFTSQLTADKKKLAAAGLAGKPVAFADGYRVSNQVTVRPFTKTSAVGAVNSALGLQNAWAVPGDAAYGLASTDVEGLTKLPAATHFLYVENNSDASSAVFTKSLSDNTVWRSLQFVVSGRTHQLPEGIWMFGGPVSMQAYATAVVSALTT